MSIQSQAAKQSNVEQRVRAWLYFIASDFDRKRFNPPLRTVIKHKDGKQYEELLDDSDWISFGYAPRPATRLGWFVYHIAHGLLMHYPLRSVLAFALLNSPPPPDKRSSEIQTTTMKDNRIELWLNQADLTGLAQFARHYRISSQRIIETALAQAVARGLPAEMTRQGYDHYERIPLRLDRLGCQQLEALAAQAGISHQDVLRLALRTLIANLDPISTN